MERGDISNSEAPRYVFVFEGTIGQIDSTDVLAERALCKTRQWRRAVARWDIPEITGTLMWDLSWRRGVRFDVVTYRSKGFADALRDRLADEDYPVSRVWADTPAHLARKLARMPAVLAVYDADEKRRFTYGHRGIILPGGLITSPW